VSFSVDEPARALYVLSANNVYQYALPS